MKTGVDNRDNNDGFYADKAIGLKHQVKKENKYQQSLLDKNINEDEH